MSMITDKMIGECNGHYMYKNEYGIYYFSELVDGCFINKVFSDLEQMKDYINNIGE